MEQELKKTDLASFTTETYDKGAGYPMLVLWYFVNVFIVNTSWMPIMSIKIAILRLFGAKIGKGICIKNRVNIKFPWKLVIGDEVWLGEDVWIDNVDNVTIGSNVCISQGALLLTGNHDYTMPEFYCCNAPIVIEDGVWIGAKTVVCPGVTAQSHSILTVGSIATKKMEPYGIYQGNPAKRVKTRVVK